MKMVLAPRIMRGELDKLPDHLEGLVGRSESPACRYGRRRLFPNQPKKILGNDGDR
jgi:hypothetical protein